MLPYQLIAHVLHYFQLILNIELSFEYWNNLSSARVYFVLLSLSVYFVRHGMLFLSLEIIVQRMEVYHFYFLEKLRLSLFVPKSYFSLLNHVKSDLSHPIQSNDIHLQSIS